MDNLPNDILNKIFKYKHQLEMNDVLNELSQIRINCRYMFSLSFVKSITYLTHDNIRKPCIDLNNLHVESHELLAVLKTNPYIII